MAIITISRGTFSGGEKLARLIAEKLGYKCLSREIFLEASKKYNVSLKKLSNTLDVSSILEKAGMEKQVYLAYIRLALLNNIKKGNVVYHGHAGHLLLKGIPHTLKIRVTADMEYRIKAAMERNDLDRNQAISFIRDIDKKRMEWTRFLYNEDIDDPSLYDMIINLENTTFERACRLIRSTIEVPDYTRIFESKKIEDSILAAKVVETAMALDMED